MMMMVVVEQQLAKLSSGSLTGIWTQYSSEQTHNVHRMHTQFRSHIIQCMDPTATTTSILSYIYDEEWPKSFTYFLEKVDLRSILVYANEKKWDEIAIILKYKKI